MQESFPTVNPTNSLFSYPEKETQTLIPEFPAHRLEYNAELIGGTMLRLKEKYPLGLNLILLLAGSSLLSSCIVGNQEFEGTDHTVMFPSLRASVNFLGETPTGSLIKNFVPEKLTVPVPDPNNKQTDQPTEVPVAILLLGMNLELSPSHGKFSQELRAGEHFDFGGARMDGPTNVRTEVNYFDTRVGAKIGGLFGGWFSIESLLGVWANQAQYEIDSSTQRLSRNQWNVGPYSGLQLGIQPDPHFRIYGRQISSVAFSSRLANQQILEAGFEILPQQGLGIFGAWRKQRFTEEKSGSDVDVTFEGPVFGIHLTF